MIYCIPVFFFYSFVYANSKESITLDQLSIFNPQDYQFFVNDGNENLKLMSPDVSTSLNFSLHCLNAKS